MFSLVSAPSYLKKDEVSTKSRGLLPLPSCTFLSLSPAAVMPTVVLYLLGVSKGEGYKELHICLSTVTQLWKASSGRHPTDPMPVLMMLCLSFTLLHLGSQETTPSLQAQEQIFTPLSRLQPVRLNWTGTVNSGPLNHRNMQYWTLFSGIPTS